MDDLKAKAVSELREVARFLDVHAETLIGDMDDTYIAEDGIHVGFDVLIRGSISTVTVSKEHLVLERNR